MKQQTSEPATKQDLNELENRFEEKFATKDDLKNQIFALEIRTDIKMETMERRIDDKARKYRDEVLTKMDGLAKDLKTILQELIMTNKRVDRALDRIENHEARITQLETNQNHN